MGNYKFYFSSELYRRKFEQEIENYIKLEETKINTKYKVQINLARYLAIALYKRIEKRGFLVVSKTGMVITENVKFIDGIIKE